MVNDRTSGGLVLDHPADGIVRIGIDRPEARNSLTEALIHDLHTVLDTTTRDGTAAIILTSPNGQFCAGFDMTSYDGDPETIGGSVTVIANMDRLADLTLRLRNHPAMVIAAVRGAAVGGGFGLALGADIVLAGRSARFMLPQARLGVSAAEMGLSFLLPRIVGLNRAARWMLLGEPIDAEQAEHAGLVSEVHPDDEVDGAALTLASVLASGNRDALALTKRMLLAGVQSGHLELTARAETQAQVLANYSPEFRAVIARWRADRTS